MDLHFFQSSHASKYCHMSKNKLRDTQTRIIQYRYRYTGTIQFMNEQDIKYFKKSIDLIVGFLPNQKLEIADNAELGKPLLHPL